MTTLGLDLSLTATGCVVLTDGKLTDKVLIKTKPPELKSALTEIKRILSIVETIEGIITEHDIAMVVIEGLSFGARNTTALIQLSGLNYLVRKLLYDYNIPFCICAPTTLKKFITGHGDGSKDVIMMSIYKKYGVTLADNNIADAYGLARIAEALKGNVKLTVFQKEVISLLTKNL